MRCRGSYGLGPVRWKWGGGASGVWEVLVSVGWVLRDVVGCTHLILPQDNRAQCMECKHLGWRGTGCSELQSSVALQAVGSCLLAFDSVHAMEPAADPEPSSVVYFHLSPTLLLSPTFHPSCTLHPCIPASLHPCLPTCHPCQVLFQLAVFAPFVGEVLIGRLTACDETGLHGE